VRPDPLRPPRGAANVGAAGLARDGSDSEGRPQWELADVVAYNSATHTSVLRTHSGRPLSDVPQIRATAGSYDHLPTGATVVVSYALGFPAIIGCIDMPGAVQTAIPSPSLTGVAGVGDDNPVTPTDGTSNFKPPGAPTDMTAGDWAQVGRLGNHVAVLEGGVSQIGSPTAMLQSLGATGTLRTLARRLQQITDFGQLLVQNDNGKTSLTLRAGANQTTQTGLDEQHWTIYLDLGSEGDVFDFRIADPEGRTLFRLHAGSDGRVQLYGDGGVDLTSGANGTATMRNDVAGDRAETTAGDHTHAVTGDSTTSVDGASSASVGGTAMRSVGSDSTDYVGGDHDLGVGGDQTLAVGGARKAATGGDDSVSAGGNWTATAMETSTVDANVQVKLGANAVDANIKGTTFNATVMSQVGAAGAAATAAGATAVATISPDLFTGTPSIATTTAVGQIAAALTAIGSLLSAAAAATPSTLSTKVVTE
jgi:hypothetical protein